MYQKRTEIHKLLIILILIAFSLFLAGCGEKEELPQLTSLLLSLSKSRIVGDGVDYSVITVLDQNGMNALKKAEVFLDGGKVSGDKIKSSIPGTSTVYAQSGTVISNTLTIQVVEDKNLKFEKQVLIEQYTGTWCGWCPRAVFQINNLEKTDKKTVHVAHHLTDEMSYAQSASLFQSFGFIGIPTVHADRGIVWQGVVNDIAALHSPARVGIALEVTGSSSRITVNASLKFGYDFNDNLELCIYLIHDSLVSNQTNYYNTDPNSPYYQKGSPMLNFVHRNVLVKAGTDILGDLIPSSSVDIASTYSKVYDIYNFRCDDIKKISAVAIVALRDGFSESRVLNVARAKVGEKKELVYAVK